jgi:hypothetical protein
MMLHQDGSRHHWLAGKALDLFVIMDGATSTIYSAFLVEEEGTASKNRACLILHTLCSSTTPRLIPTAEPPLPARRARVGWEDWSPPQGSFFG